MKEEELKEEVKKQILNNEQQQGYITINAQFISLTTQLIKKGILKIKDIDEMQKTTNEYIEMLNENIINKAMKELEDFKDE